MPGAISGGLMGVCRSCTLCDVKWSVGNNRMSARVLFSSSESACSGCSSALCQQLCNELIVCFQCVYTVPACYTFLWAPFAAHAEHIKEYWAAESCILRLLKTMIHALKCHTFFPGRG